MMTGCHMTACHDKWFISRAGFKRRNNNAFRTVFTFAGRKADEDY